MASTISLAGSINWVKPFLFFKPLAFAASNNEPAVSSANLVQQTIVGPPFRWNWNRKYISFTCVPAQQDYVVSMADFGFIEKATASYSGDKTIEIEVINGLSEDTVPGRPRFVSAQIDDNGDPNTSNVSLFESTITAVSIVNNTLTVTANNEFSVGQMVLLSGLTNATFLNGKTVQVLTASDTDFTALFVYDTDSDVDYTPLYPDTGTASSGNITFRLMPVPEKTYTITVIYQKKVPLMSSLADFWTVPDHYSYIYQMGFMALMMQFSDDSRWQLYNAKFVTHLLAAAEGLNETQRNIFLASWQAITGQPMYNALYIQQGVQSRGQL